MSSQTRLGNGLVSIVIAVLLVGCISQEMPPATAQSTPTYHPILTAENTLREYCAALQAKEYEKAALLFSTKVGIAKSELIRLWKDNDARGWKLNSCEVTDRKVFDENRIVFWVDIRQDGLEPAQYTAINVLHFEQNTWLVGNATLDKPNLNVRPKTRNQLTAFPGVMLRLVSGIEVWINLTNNNDRAVLWGVEGETCGRLFWRDFALDSSCPSPAIRIEPGQTLDLPLTFSIDAFTRSKLPTGLEVSWFSLDANTTNTSVTPIGTWNYRFDLITDLP